MPESRSFWRQLGRPTIAALVLVGIAGVWIIDLYTGTNVRVFPLYFLPLALAAKRLGLRGALFASLLASIAWIVAQHLGGRVYPHPIYWSINFLTQGTAFVVVSILVARLEARLVSERVLSRTDALTGLLNSRAFHEHATRALVHTQQRDQAVTLAYLDLDRFKQVNDRFGHEAGDRLLSAIGALLQAQLGGSGLVARVGGDEFAALLPGIDEAVATRLLEETRSALLANPEVAATGVSASIGGIIHQHGPVALDDLIRQADALMYAVKNDSRNAVRVARSEEHYATLDDQAKA